jgi:chaperone modulatory protein CbpM
MDAREFLMHARIEADLLEAWIEAGWIMPQPDAESRQFSDVDVARARLIHDLKGGMGVNDEGVAIILDLIDQIHGVRATLRNLLACLQAQPDSVRRKIMVDARGARSARD